MKQIIAPNTEPVKAKTNSTKRERERERERERKKGKHQNYKVHISSLFGVKTATRKDVVMMARVI